MVSPGASEITSNQQMLKVTTKTWSRDSHGLFDYEATNTKNFVGGVSVSRDPVSVTRYFESKVAQFRLEVGQTLQKILTYLAASVITQMLLKICLKVNHQ